MILNVSGRTDVVAFYSEWFINRYREGFVDVRNPFNNKLVSRINFEDVDMIVFCTKNPLPIIPYLKEIDKPILFQVTLTGYDKDIEPNVIDKTKIIEGIKEVSKIIGKDNVNVRYDPIFISDKYNAYYHVKALKKLCDLLDGYISKVIISFIDDYKNVRKNYKDIGFRDFIEEDYKIIGTEFSKIAEEKNIIIHTCFEKRTLEEYGLKRDDCVSHTLTFKMTGKTGFKTWKARGEGNCKCVEMIDIGVYNTCRHFCKYCYANYDERKVLENMKKHNPNSSLLIGELSKDDVIKIRRK
ncbi:MAG: DUF1848 domain-containing protein [Bacilli bacterium]|nr:DUF1848 domain-containing protein [Bacilli bacterium]